MTEQKIANLAGRTAIIADDDDIVRSMLRSVLRVVGLNVLAETSNGERTLAAYLEHRPQIVCLDINMPGISGLEVLSEIRKISTETIILIVSAETTQGNTRKAIEEKADGIIAKPFNTARVTSEIERALHKRASIQQPTFKLS